MGSIQTISGGIAQDQRGSIRFVNDFNLTAVKRFYIIENSSTEIVRGWRAHRTEQRWFFILEGGFSMSYVKVDDWDQPSRELEVSEISWRASDNSVVHVPAGFATAFRALEARSKLLVFADFGIEHAKDDDFTYALDYFYGFNSNKSARLNL